MVKGQRQSALAHIRALDHQLLLAVGVGLIAYAVAAGVKDLDIVIAYLMEGVIPPILCIHLDEGSPAYAMTWFLANHEDIRIISTRDIYHREWNDIKLALSKANLWHVVIMMTVVYNMPHGPWDSGAWFNKIRKIAITMVESMTSANPLFTPFYELVCADMGVTPRGDAEHKAMVWQTLFGGSIFRLRGEKVSLRRWFGWLAASDLYLPKWHSILLSIVCLGQVMNVYKDWTDVPLWAEQVSWVRNQACDEEVSDDGEDEMPGSEDSDDDDEDHPNVRHARREMPDAAEARAAAEAVEGAKHVVEDDKGAVKENPKETMQQIRANSKNTCFACGFILSRENGRRQVAMITEMCRPVWTAHSKHASECRDPEAVAAWYQESALGLEYMAVMAATARILLNMQLLANIGFMTEYGSLPKNAKTIDPVIQTETASAFTMVDLFCCIAFQRISSMLFHSRALPGYLALLSSSDDKIYDMGMKKFLRDWAAYQVGLTKAKASTFIAKLVKTSPFQMRLVREIALMATAVIPGLDENDRRHKIQKLLYYVFKGWGQTKVVEDNFKNCRYVETQGILNKTRTCSAYYGAMSQMGTIALHKRKEISIDEDTPVAKGKPAEIFHCEKHKPSLPNAGDITGRSSWQTFSPQSSKIIQADMWVLGHCNETHLWALAEKCDQCDFFQRRTIIQKKAEPSCFYIVLGSLVSRLLLVWMVEAVSIPKTNYNVFLVGTDAVDNKDPRAFIVLNIEEFVVIPAAPVAPAHYFLALKRSLPEKMGVVLLQHGKTEPVLLHAANNAFFDLGLPRLKALCKEYSIETPCVTLAPTLCACVKHFIHLYTKKMPTDTELQSILSLRCQDTDGFVGDICDEDMLIELLGADDQQAYKALPQCRLRFQTCLIISVFE